MSDQRTLVPPDRRERKKQATRDALQRAATQLFVEKGYVNTTIRDITDRADVGARTFYRHFEGKEDIMLLDLREYLADAEDVLRSCPPDWSPIRAYLELVDRLRVKWTKGDQDLAFQYHVIEADPSLNGRFHNELMKHHGRISELYAERLGTDRFDPRLWTLATVLVDAFLGSLVVKVRGHSELGAFDCAEQIILMMAEGLDPEAAAHRRRHREA